MPHFSRLTDIITCSLSDILSTSEHPAQTLTEIIEEMNEGLGACRRNVRTAMMNADRLHREIKGYEYQISEWKDHARTSLSDGDEDKARDALTRKVELEDLISGLRPELDAAHAAQQQMFRIQKALEARHAEAIRKLEELTGQPTAITLESETAVISASAANVRRQSEIEAELAALKKELGT
ncbi:MAG: PspA/IM30 family protein [Planctomycetota bacterium]